MKKILLIFLSLLILLTPTISSALTLKMVETDGSLKATFPALNQGKRILADIDDFFGSLNFDISWNSSLERMEASGENSAFRFRPGSKFVRSNEDQLSLARAPIKEDGNLFVDVESLVDIVSEHSKYSMIWNDARQQVQLRNPSDWSSSKSEDKENKDPIGQFIDGTERSEKKTLVVIDPGHGGRDPGAIGSNGLYEKEVVLKMGQALKEEIEDNHPQFEVRLTRDSDEFLPLQKRTQIANELDADIFLSIHANSGRTSVAKGFEVFTLSAEASDPSAKELAEVENSALRYEGYSKEELNDVSWILYQLRSMIHTRESRSVAEIISEAMEESLPIENRGMKQAPFWVLKDARMPAVLVETGFLSNPEGARRLADQNHREKVAKAIADGLNNYRRSRDDS